MFRERSTPSTSSNCVLHGGRAPPCSTSRLRRAQLDNRAGDARDELDRQRFLVQEGERVLGLTVRGDLALERLGEARHRVEPDVLLPPGEVQGVTTTEHERSDLVAHPLFRIRNLSADRSTHRAQPLGHLGWKTPMYSSTVCAEAFMGT